MFTNLTAFFVVAAAVIVTPGQDTALTVRNTLAGGRNGGLATAAGVAAGQAVWTILAAIGVTALLVGVPGAFVAVKVLGGVYLIYLGARALADAMRPADSVSTTPASVRRLGPGAAFGQGLASNLGNVKMAVFFTSLLPQFVVVPSFPALSILGVAFAVMTLAWLSGYAVLIGRAGDRLRLGPVRRTLDGASGIALVMLGLAAVRF